MHSLWFPTVVVVSSAAYHVRGMVRARARAYTYTCVCVCVYESPLTCIGATRTVDNIFNYRHLAEEGPRPTNVSANDSVQAVQSARLPLDKVHREVPGNLIMAITIRPFDFAAVSRGGDP